MNSGQFLIATLYYGAIDAEHRDSMKKALTHPRASRLLELHGCPYITMGRSIAVTAVHDTPELEGIIFIDHDIVFDYEAFDQIIESCSQTRSVVGAGYSYRRPGHDMIGGLDTSKFTGDPIFFQGGGLYPALYLGMGFTAIHRDVLETVHSKLQKVETGLNPLPCYPSFEHVQKDGKWFGEDVSFCMRAADAGFQLYMDTRLRVWHKGAYTYGLEDCGIVVPFLHQLKGVLKKEKEPILSTFTGKQEIHDAQLAERAARETLDTLPLSEASL